MLSLGWLKWWSNPNLVFLAGEMWPFPSQIMTLKFDEDQIKFTHGRHHTPFPIIKHRKYKILKHRLYIFYRIYGGWRPWVNSIWSSPDFRAIICAGNGLVTPARKMRFGFDHMFSHPTLHLAMLVGPSVRPSVCLPSVRRSVTFLNCERFLHHCPCPIVRNCPAVYPALFFLALFLYCGSGLKWL